MRRGMENPMFGLNEGMSCNLYNFSTCLIELPIVTIKYTFRINTPIRDMEFVPIFEMIPRMEPSLFRVILCFNN